jgi:hypothetical protein
MYVVYQHKRKDTGEVFYIGQGIPKRAYEDVKNRRNENWKKVVEEAGGFDVDILARDLTRDESLLIEAQYIKKYGTIKHGTGTLVNERLSGTRGVESGYKHDENKRREISERTKKAMQDPEIYKRHMDSHIAYWNKPESREKASKIMKGLVVGVDHPKARAVNQYDLNGNFIKKWPYAKAAAIELGINPSGICVCCKGKSKSYRGHKWQYAE